MFFLFFLFLFAHTPVRAFAKSAPVTSAPKKAAADDEDDSDEESTDMQSAPTSEQSQNEDDEGDDEEPDPQVIKANIAFTSDYLARGLTFSNHKPALQGGLDWEHPSGPILGTWSSSASLPDTDSSLELDAYGGYFFDFGHDQEFEEVLTLHYDTFFVGKEWASWAIAEQTSWKSLSLIVSYAPSYRENGYLITSTASWHEQIKWDILLGLNVDYTAYANQTLTTSAFESTVNAEGEEESTQILVSENTPNYFDFRLSVGHEFFSAIWQVEGVYLKKQEIEGILTSPRAAFTVSKAF
jgi:uncharacterized protein (TIGR02001 family)